METVSGTAAHTEGSAMTHTNEIPSDDQVLATLRVVGSMRASVLLKALIDAGYDRDDSQRAIRRCMNRDLIRLGANLALEPTSEMAEAA